MSAILIKSNSKKNDALLVYLAKAMKLPARILSEDNEHDLLLIQSIDEGMKSGKASKDKVNKLFAENGIRVH